MGKVLSFTDKRARSRPIFFDRRELSKLLNLYSRRVMMGEWRDYAIDHDEKRAVFSIFRNSAECPIFSIAKVSSGKRDGMRYVVTRGWGTLDRTRTIDEAVTLIEQESRAAPVFGRA